MNEISRVVRPSSLYRLPIGIFLRYNYLVAFTGYSVLSFTKLLPIFLKLHMCNSRLLFSDSISSSYTNPKFGALEQPLLVAYEKINENERIEDYTDAVKVILNTWW